MEKSILEMVGGEKHIKPHYDIKAESQGITNKLHQLAKAKEIIENLIDALETIDGEQVRELTEVKQAERFLSEVKE